MEKRKSFLFKKIDVEKGYVVPNQKFWELWESEKQNAVRKLGFEPRPYGELVGSTSKWVVSLPRGRYIGRICRRRNSG